MIGGGGAPRTSHSDPLSFRGGGGACVGKGVPCHGWRVGSGLAGLFFILWRK
jgi:hypothetical protein